METRKRILFLADINSTHIEHWVLSLTDRGYLIDLFSLSEKQVDWPDTCEGFTYRCFGLGQSTVRSSKRYGKLSYFRARKEAKKFFDEVQPDLVHAHYASSYGMLARYLGFEKTVLSLWGSDVYEFPKRSFLHAALFKKSVKFSKIVCSTSKAMAVEAKKWVDIDYVITPFGVDTERFALTKSEEKSEMLTLGTIKLLEDVYGIDRLINLYAKFREVYNGPSCLKIYGRGSKEAELKAQVAELGLENEITFGGWVDDDKLLEAFHSIDISVILSRRESFGVSALEAQSCGIPVFATNVGGLPEVVSPETGVVVDEDRPETWLNLLVELVSKAEGGALQEASRDFILQNYSQEVCADKIIQVYNDVEGIIA